MNMTPNNVDILFHLFPFGVLLDHTGHIVQLGRSISKVIPMSSGESFSRYLKSRDGFKSDTLPAPFQMFWLNVVEGIQIRGQLLPVEQGFFFSGTVGLNNTKVMKDFNVTFKDFSNQDNVFDFLMLLGSQEHSIEQLQKILDKLKMKNKLSDLMNQIAVELDSVTAIDDVFILASKKLKASFPLSELTWSKVRKKKDSTATSYTSYLTVLKVDEISGAASSHPELLDNFREHVEQREKHKKSDIIVEANDGEDVYLGLISVNPNEIDIEKEEQVFGLISRLLQSKILALSNEKQKTEMMLHRTHLGRIAMLGELSAGVAHEINNPLAIISFMFEKMNLNLVQDGLYEKYKGDFEVVRNSIDRIVKIIQGLKAYARGGASDVYIRTPVKKLLDDSWILMQAKYKQNEIDFKVDTLDESILISCSPVQIVQILTNLLSNSADAVTGMHTRRVRMSCERRDNFARFEVRDSGNKIPLEIAEKIMNPFFTTKDPGKGTGLGLSLSHTIASQHKGRLYLDQERSETCFVLELPLEK